MHSLIKKRTALALGALTLTACPTVSWAQSQDALLDKLVNKGILTQDEAKELRDDADEGFKKAYQAKSGLPDWVTSLRFNGDFRGRYEGFYTSKAAERHRYRYRLRFGFVANMTDDFEVGFRLGSGDATATTPGFIDPISNNQTLENNGAKKGIFVDLAYGKWSPINNSDWGLSITAGKMENPFVFSDLVFDTDYTPEGAALQARYTINDHHSLKWAGGFFVMDEIGGSSRDPYMIGAQARWDGIWDQKRKWQTSAGVGVLSIQHDENLGTAAVPNINLGNTRNAAGNLTEGFNPIVADASITYSLDSFPFYTGAFPIKLAADYIHNPTADNANEGYSVGLTLGKSGKRKTWDLSYRWKELQSNAWYEEFVDSDSGAYYTSAFSNSGLGTGYRSGTNVRGHVIKAAYSPFDSFTMGVTYFLLRAIDENPAGSGSAIGRLQVDAVWKF